MILVIGATGYVGRYFCVEMTKKGEDILALGRSQQALDFLSAHNVKTQFFDISDDESFDKLPASDIEGVINLSACLAEVAVPVEKFFEVNTIGVYKTLEWAYRHGITKVVTPSSHKLYNDVHKEVIAESDPICFRGDHSPYIISKIAAENFSEYYNTDFGMQSVMLRFTGVHGYGEILGHLKEDGSYQKSTFEIFFERILKGQPIEVWGDQSIKRDHVYIKDVTSALLAALRSDSAIGIYNIASGVAYSQLEEAEALIDVFSPQGKRSEIILCPEKPGLTRGYCYDISKAKADLGWSPSYVDLRKLYSDYKMEWERKVFHNYHHFLDGQGPATL